MMTPTDTIYSDTLFYNANRVVTWQSDSAYDYNRELMTREINVLQLMGEWLGKLLQKIVGNSLVEYTELVLIMLFVLLLLTLLWFLYRKRPELFMRSKKSLPYQIHEDTIYGVDFSKEIDVVLSRKEFREAARLLYLHTLKQLSDAGLIVWQPYKTPTEYIYELKHRINGNTFRDLTNRFLRVRYGNFEATESLFREMESLQHELIKEIGLLPVKTLRKEGSEA